MTKELGAALKKVLIYKGKDGVYYSYLFLEKEGEVFKIDSRTSDAIALAMRCGCPVSTTDEIMEREPYYEHTLEGWDDMPAHAKATIIGCLLYTSVAGRWRKIL